MGSLSARCAAASMPSSLRVGALTGRATTFHHTSRKRRQQIRRAPSTRTRLVLAIAMPIASVQASTMLRSLALSKSAHGRSTAPLGGKAAASVASIHITRNHRAVKEGRGGGGLPGFRNASFKSRCRSNIRRLLNVDSNLFFWFVDGGTKRKTKIHLNI